jgi:hypothetical protein
LRPGDDRYAAEVFSNNLNNPLAPAFSVAVTTVADVHAMVSFAARHHLPLAVRASASDRAAQYILTET